MRSFDVTTDFATSVCAASNSTVAKSEQLLVEKEYMITKAKARSATERCNIALRIAARRSPALVQKRLR